MKQEHKAILARAEKEGLLPSELAAELIVHDMVNATRAQMSRYEVGYNKMTEKQQDAVLAELQDNYKGIAEIVGRILASAKTSSVRMTCKDMKISNGTLTGIVSSDEPAFNQLISKVQDKSEVLVVLYEREYSEALDNIQSEKDQKSLPLEGDAPNSGKSGKPKTERAGSATSAAKLAAKAIELPPKLIEDGRAFLIKQQVPKPAALQNFLKIGLPKAEALLKKYEEEGLIEFVGTDASGEYQMVRKPIEKVEASPIAVSEPEFADEPLTFDGEDDGQPLVTDQLTEELYDRIKSKVVADAQFSSGALLVAFDLNEDVLQQATDRLEMEGIISEENELGVRSMAAAE